MSVYPFELDSDNELPRLDDNLSELGVEAINALRDAVFNVQSELGITPSGSLNSVAERLDVSLNANGTIKTSALTSVGLVTLPIIDSYIADGAGIKEFKLDLDFTTANLHTLIQANATLINSLNSFTNTLETTLNSHIGGSPTTELRHVGSHIDLNAVPSDTRDPFYVWGGLKDKDGNDRTATNVAQALDQINESLITHENITVVNSPGAHPASAIYVDSSEFVEISQDVNNVQDALESLDNADNLRIGLHRATMHSNGVLKDARSQSFVNPDGYRENVVPVTSAVTHVAHSPPGTAPVDNTVSGDELVVFKPDNTGFLFDSQFSQVRVGDHVRINYGNGLEAQTLVESIRFIPGSEWVIRTSKTNLVDTDCDGYDGYDAYVRIDRPLFDDNTYGVMAVAAANATPPALFSGLLGSVIVGHPKGASALGIGFDPNQLDATHHLLYLELYPTGDPRDHIISLPGIDVTGDLGTKPGRYTLQKVVQETNNSLRKIGYNFRFIAFSYAGNFGIMLADAINGASFAIVSGDNSSGSLTEGSYPNNVVGNARAENFDALGLGAGRADVASPKYQSTFTSSIAAQLPTKVIVPLKRREYISNGTRRDSFAATYFATLDSNGDGYWPAIIENRAQSMATVEVTYKVDLDLQPAELKPGKTIVVQNVVPFSDSLYKDADYGRFIIKEVVFIPTCPGVPGYTLITVINGIHGTGEPVDVSSEPELPVKLYFSEDSVGFNSLNLIDSFSGGVNYHRLHEIYVTNRGETFSHERARMPVLTTSGTALGTNRWHITDVSPKFKGYRLDSSTDLNKYIRLVISEYDVNTGEFTGRIGKPTLLPTTLERPGPITVGRKNVPVRFYDETNVDYVELIFRDESDSPVGSPLEGDAVMPNNSDRAVDIEIFASLALDDELLKLATCEVNWQPETGTDNIEYVRDTRPHGSISEKEFTQSAKDFIQAGDRHLHTNGVIRGLGFVAQSANDDREFFFDGGVAFVDGAIVSVNQGSVTIPEIFNTANAPTPDTVDWAVCVNKYGDLVPIILTVAKQQFFAQDNVSGNKYYVPSVTFAELIANRKDLTVISTITATIASFTLDSVKDARRFVKLESESIPFTWAGEGSAGHFYSFEAVANWINNYGSQNNTVKVKGEFTVSSAIDMSGLEWPVTFEGENAIFNVLATRGIILGNNITIRGITFNYNPLSFTATNAINAGNACLYSEASLTNILIENCKFATSYDQELHPFINFHSSSDGLYNVVIRYNNFETFATTVAQPTIAFTGASGDLLAEDIKIYDNVCSQEAHGIYIIGMFTSNCFISRNKCASIGYDIKGESSISPFTKNSLTISENSCSFIARMTIAGLTALSTESSGNIKIINNNCNWIFATCVNISSLGRGGIYISGNILTAYDNAFINSNHGSASTAGIAVWGVTSNNELATAIISNNHIEKDYIGGTYNYTSGIVAARCSSEITGNVIVGEGASADLIYLDVKENQKAIVTGNQLSRTDDIRSYINATGSTGNAIIVDNILDQPTIDGADEGVFIGIPAHWIVERNVNQTATITVRPHDAGMFLYGDAFGVFGFLIPQNSNIVFVRFVERNSISNPHAPLAIAVDAGTEANFDYKVSLNSILSKGIKVVRCSVQYDGLDTAHWATSSLFSLSLFSKGSSSDTLEENDPVDLKTSATGTLEIESSPPIIGDNTYIRLRGEITAEGGPNRLFMTSALTITYRW